MLPVLTPDEMAAADAAAIAGGTPQEVLMDRAGYAVARATRDQLGGTYGRRVVVVEGKGNNGGDGAVAATYLRRWGVRVDEFHIDDDISDLQRCLARSDAAIDAMFGTGFRGVLDGNAEQAAVLCNDSLLPVIAVDIPSGVHGDTGEVAGAAVRASQTVCFAALKPGVCFEPGRTLAGSVELVDIGIDVSTSSAGVTEARDVSAWLPKRKPNAHKWAAGAVFVVGGSAGMIGAPKLSSAAAMHAGAGIVWCGVPGERAALNVSGTEVVAHALPTSDGVLDDAATEEVLRDASRFGALVVGPGAGTDERTVKALQRLVIESPVPVVLDADGLNAFVGDADLLRSAQSSIVLTPHPGEFQRLSGNPVGDDRLTAARSLAQHLGAVVLLKGPGTVIADPNGRVAINSTGGPALATAGSGDVLSGVIGAFIARGVEVWNAAAAGAWVHGQAADSMHISVAGDLAHAIASSLSNLESEDE